MRLAVSHVEYWKPYGLGNGAVSKQLSTAIIRQESLALSTMRQMTPVSQFRLALNSQLEMHEMHEYRFQYSVTYSTTSHTSLFPDVSWCLEQTGDCIVSLLLCLTRFLLHRLVYSCGFRGLE